MSGYLEWFSNFLSSSSVAIGPKANAPLFLSEDKEIIFKDRDNGNYYRLYFRGGQLRYEQVQV